MFTEKIDLKIKYLNIKKRLLEMYYSANAGHVGSSLSCLEILTFIYFKLLNKNESDIIILSKGHAAAALYSLYAEDGILNKQQIKTFYKDGTILSAHPPPNKIPQIPFATGSLGHGLSISAGFGISSRIKCNNRICYCITSDGELNEGSIWEAALFISNHKLNNVVWFIDRNYLQGFGLTEEVIKLEPLDKKLEAFGFNVFIIDGHSFSDFYKIKNDLFISTKPTVVICNTIKGYGWENYENKLSSHYLPLKDKEFNDMIDAIENELNQLQNDYEK